KTAEKCDQRQQRVGGRMKRLTAQREKRPRREEREHRHGGRAERHRRRQRLERWDVGQSKLSEDTRKEPERTAVTVVPERLKHHVLRNRARIDRASFGGEVRGPRKVVTLDSSPYDERGRDRHETDERDDAP